jgi:hypothetical protein
LLLEAGEYDVRCTLIDRVYAPDVREQRFEIGVDWTEVNYGGRRAWFLCPACGERKTKLHLMSVPYRLQCARCLGLKYGSKSRSPLARKIARYERLQAELRGSEREVPRKPKGQHLSTYKRKLAEFLRLEQQLAAALGLEQTLRLRTDVVVQWELAVFEFPTDDC